MATFLDLPNELKLDIIELIPPDDIENFALCCKLVHGLALKILRQHEADKRTYSTFFPGLMSNTGYEKSLAGLYKLHNLAQSRRLQLYPKLVQLKSYRPWHMYWFSDPDWRRAKSVEGIQVMGKVRSICNDILNEVDSPYISKLEMKSWCNKTGAGDLRAANCVLLTLLPNVERIFVLEIDFTTRNMSDMIYRISQTNRRASSLLWTELSELSLVKLQEVTIHSFFLRGGATRYSGVLEAFMTLPSLHIVRGNCLGRIYVFKKSDDYPDHYSNVDEFHFRNCTLAVFDLASLFSYVKTLRIFSYDHSRVPEAPGKEYGPDALINALRSSAEETLTFLNYTSDAKDAVCDHRMPGAGTLSSFKALKTLRISRVILIAQKAPQRLVDELPSSLEELELVDPISTMEAEQMLEGMLAMKKERLPNLRLIVFEGAIPFDDEAIAAYECMGLVLDWRDMGTNRIQKTCQTWLGGIECMRLIPPIPMKE